MLKHYYWFWESAVPEEICDFIVNSCNWSNAEDGTVYDGNTNSFVSDEKKRTTDVIWAPQMSVVGCIASTYIKAANEVASWNYKYSHMENVQIGRYKQGGHYDWHKDTFSPNDQNEQRKLSMSILLNDPSEFTGGEFMFKDLDDYQQPNLKKGSVLVFPSFLEHTVIPVTTGLRYSAVTWVTGPAFC
jgi:PKHD-type hydroxylase